MPKSPHRRSTRPAKRHQLEACASDEQKELFQCAADLEGRSLTDFVIASVHSAAMSTIEAAEIIRLNAIESRKLAENLLGPARKPNEAMRTAKQHYRDAAKVTPATLSAHSRHRETRRRLNTRYAAVAVDAINPCADGPARRIPAALLPNPSMRITLAHRP